MSIEAKIKEPSVLIRISKLYDEAMTTEELYEATRGVWKVGSRRDEAEYPFSIAGGEVKEVYKITSWLPAGTLPSTTQDQGMISKLLGDGSLKESWPRRLFVVFTLGNLLRTTFQEEQ
jgi:hypothetical protein